jgi:hypothetical protein
VQTIDPVWQYVIAVTRPALLLAPSAFIEGMRPGAAGIRDAVAQHDTPRLLDWMLPLLSLQGIGDARALGWDARHGGVTFAQIEAGLAFGTNVPPPQFFLVLLGMQVSQAGGHLRRD